MGVSVDGVWLVVSFMCGEGDDVEAVFATREAAEAFARPRCPGWFFEDYEDGAKWRCPESSRTFRVEFWEVR